MSEKTGFLRRLAGELKNTWNAIENSVRPVNGTPPNLDLDRKKGAPEIDGLSAAKNQELIGDIRKELTGQEPDSIVTKPTTMPGKN